MGDPDAAKNTCVKVRWDEKWVTDPLVVMERVAHPQSSM